MDDRCLLSTIPVTNLNDHGPGSLRAAIIAANASPANATPMIQFQFPFGIHTDQIIELATPLPAVTHNNVSIDATPPNSFFIDGTGAGNCTGLQLEGDDCSVTGLGVLGCESSAILVEGNGDVLNHCNVGADANEVPGHGNGIGVYVYQTNDVTIEYSNIWENTQDGILVFSSGGILINDNQVANNGGDGVRVLAGALGPGETFVTSIQNDGIGGNAGNGVHLVDSSDNLIGTDVGNDIGYDLDATPSNGNGGDGVLIEEVASGPSASNTIANSYIADNGGNGVRLTGSGTSQNTVTDNFIGIAQFPSMEGYPGGYLENLGNKLDGVMIDGGTHDNVIGGEGLFLQGNVANGAGNVIVGNQDNEVELSDPGTSLNLVQGNMIGWVQLLDLVNLEVNTGDGVLITNGAAKNLIGGGGGTAIHTGEGNLISNSAQSGVDLSGTGTSDNLVLGNLIGTTESGTGADGNFTGVTIESGASDNQVGGAANGADRTLGNVISGNADFGVLIDGTATTGDTVQSNLIGTDITGNGALPNGGDGLAILEGASNNMIGGVNVPEKGYLAGNVISGNTLDGVNIAQTGTNTNTLEGNLIGIDANASQALPNQMNGVLVSLGASGTTIGGNNPDLGNLISGNMLAGVVMSALATKTIVQNDAIGTTGDKNHACGNVQDGVELQASGNSLIDNVVSGNLQNGVVVNGSDNNLFGNEIGANVLGTAAVPNRLDGVVMNITIGPGENSLGGSTVGDGNLISGNSGNGVHLEGTGSAGNQIEGNLIGTNGLGEEPVANVLDGVLAASASGFTVGGSVPGAGNLISGNTLDGVEITGPASTGLLVLGNQIGTDIHGQISIGNGSNGVVIQGGAYENVIGGTGPYDGNLISGNDANGVKIAGGTDITGDFQTRSNQVLGNRIGTKSDAKHALANELNGIEIVDSNNNTIGGTPTNSSTPGNVISGNTLDGLLITGASSSNVVRGNFIGTTTGGEDPLGNHEDGVLISAGASSNQIGGSGGVGPAGAGNFISGNTQDGVQINGAGTNMNVVAGNAIGTYSSGLTGKGNVGNGVSVFDGASQNLIGGATTGFANVIAYNGAAGVVIGHTPGESDTVSDAILSNSIYSNSGLGIDLGDNGVTENTPGSPHVGANNLLSTPTIVDATNNSQTQTTVFTLSLNAAPGSTFLIQIFANPTLGPDKHGDGKTFVTQLFVTTDSHGSVTRQVTLPLDFEGQYLSATTTDSSLDTSEFSEDAQVN